MVIFWHIWYRRKFSKHEVFTNFTDNTGFANINHEYFMHHQSIVLLIVAFKMSGILWFFKLLKESELNPKSRELASKKVKKCKERKGQQL